MSSDDINIKVEVRTRELQVKLKEIVDSIGGMKIENSPNGRKPELLIFELGHDLERDFVHVKSLLDAKEVHDVFLTSEQADKEILLRAMRLGAKEFFSHPINVQDLLRALKEYRNSKQTTCTQQTKRHGQMINVVGSKGGVGTTTVAVNLATCLAAGRNCKNVALVDLNMFFGELPLFLSVKPTYHWGQIVENFDRLDSAFLENVLAKHRTGVNILCAPSTWNGYPVFTADMIIHLFDIMKSVYDFIIVDCGQSAKEALFSVAGISTYVLLVSTLNLQCLSNTKKLLTAFRDFGIETDGHLKILINRYQQNSTITLEDAEESVGKDVFWTIPNDYSTTMSAINQGKSILEISRKSAVGKSFRELTSTLITGEKPQRKKTWIFFKQALSRVSRMSSQKNRAEASIDKRKDLMSKSIHDLRKLAGHKRIMKGMTKEKFVEEILAKN
jgi:pilus assembly protein CpaE